MNYCFVSLCQITSLVCHLSLFGYLSQVFNLNIPTLSQTDHIKMKFLALLPQNPAYPFPFLLFQTHLWSCSSSHLKTRFMFDTSSFILSLKPPFFFYPISQKSLFPPLCLDLEFKSLSRTCTNQDKKPLISFFLWLLLYILHKIFLNCLKGKKDFLRDP